MATKSLKALFNPEEMLAQIEKNATDHAKGDVAPEATPVETVVPVEPQVEEKPKKAFKTQALENMKAAKTGLLDSINPVNPETYRIQAVTRMPGETHKAATFKLDKRLIALLDELSRKQNIAALFSFLVARGLDSVLNEMEENKTTTSLNIYEADARDAFCGVTNETLLAMIAHIEKNGE